MGRKHSKVWVRAGLTLALLAALAPAAAGQSCLEETYRWPYGVSHLVAVDGATALVTSGAAVLVVDLTAPRTPVVRGEVVIDNLPHGLAVDGGLAAVIDADGVLSVINLDAPSGPEIVGAIVVETSSITGYWHGPSVELEDDLAFVTAGSDGLRVISLADPAAPTEVGVLDPPGETAVEISVVGSMAVVASESSGTWVVDVADPTNPLRVAVWPQTTTAVEARGSLAFLPDGDAVTILDLSNPAAPAQAGVFDPAYSIGTIAVTPNGARLFVHGENHIKEIDVGNPASPVEVGETAVRIDSTSDLAASDGLVVSTYVLGDFQVFDTQVPEHPYLVGWVVLRYEYQTEITVADDRAYLAGAGVLRIFDVADPRRVRELGRLFSVQPTLITGPIAVWGDHAFVGGPDGVYVIDVSVPDSPVVVATISLPLYYPDTLATYQGHLYVGFGYDPTLLVFDIGDPLQPEEVGSLGVSTRRFTISGSHAYSIREYSDAINVIDLAIPSQPSLVTSISVADGLRLFGVNGGLLATDNNYQGITVYDVSNPSSPVQLGSLDDLGGVNGITVAGDRAFVSSWSSGGAINTGVDRVDLSDPSLPTLIDRLPTPRPMGVTVDNERVFVANDVLGMTVFAECALFLDGFETGDTSGWDATIVDGEAPRGMGR